MKVLQIGISTAALVALASCGSFADSGKRIDYGADAKKVPTLEVPPDLSAPSVDDRFKVPEGEVATYSDYNRSAAEQKQILDAVLPEIPGVRLERNGAQRWLLVSEKPEKVWDVVKTFWQENGLPIKSEEQAAGLMETDWAENRAKISHSGPNNVLDEELGSKVYSVGERDQYRTRLERSKDGSGTEVYITHRGMEEVFSNDKKVSQWQARGSDPEKEATMLQRLMVRFGSSEARAADAVKENAAAPASGVTAAGTMAAPAALTGVSEPVGTSSLRELPSGTVVIVMNDTYDKSWRKVGLALESARLALDDKDREKGVYYLKPVKVEGGWLDGLMFWRPAKTVSYRISVKDGGAACEVSVADQDGARNKVTKQLTETIFKNIDKQ